MANLTKGEIVYVAVYSYKNLECSSDDYITTKVFSDIKKAEDWVARDFANAKDEYSDGDTATEIIKAENYGESAEINIGYHNSEEITAMMEWRIQKKGVDND